MVRAGRGAVRGRALRSSYQPSADTGAGLSRAVGPRLECGEWGRHQPPRPGPALQTSSEVGGSVIGCRDNRTPREPGPATLAPGTALAAGRGTALLWTEGDTETGHRGEEGRLAGRRENEISKRGDKKIATIREK